MNEPLAARSLGALVAEAPARARVLEQFGLDYCCHGERSLDEATRDAGLDVEIVAAALDAALLPGPAAPTATDPLSVIDDIMANHHAFLSEELPALVALAAKVRDVHGSNHPELGTVHDLVAALRADLEPHMVKEEQILFPAVRLLAEGRREFLFGTIGIPIRVMALEHERAGELLSHLREVTAGYTVPGDGCASYQELYRRLQHLEADTHLHIHKENNLLFPMATALQAAS